LVKKKCKSPFKSTFQASKHEVAAQELAGLIFPALTKQVGYISGRRKALIVDQIALVHRRVDRNNGSGV